MFDHWEINETGRENKDFVNALNQLIGVTLTPQEVQLMNQVFMEAQSDVQRFQLKAETLIDSIDAKDPIKRAKLQIAKLIYNAVLNFSRKDLENCYLNLESAAEYADNMNFDDIADLIISIIEILDSSFED